MKVVIAQFSQESCSFTPIISDMENFKSCFYAEGDLALKTRSEFIPMARMAELLESEGIEAIPAVAALAGSSGKVDAKTAEQIIGVIINTIKQNAPVDGVFLSLHGAMELTNSFDGEGDLLQMVREAAGEKAVIAAGLDFHANVTQKMVANADILTGYKTYPHTDITETSLRAARLGIEILKGRKSPFMVHMKLPMIHQAEACMTTEGPMKKLIEAAAKLEKNGVYDITIMQMQPWLDVAEAGASVIVIAADLDKAYAAAQRVAKAYWGIKDDLKYELHNLDDILALAARGNGKPVIISDSADAPSAGAPGDSAYVLSRAIELNLTNLKGSTTVVDPECVKKAFEAGVGAVKKFTFGGLYDKKRAKPVTVTAEAVFLNEKPITVGESLTLNTGKSALLKTDNIYTVVTSLPVPGWSPMLYEGHGLIAREADFIVAKSATQYKQFYADLTDMMYTVDTPGSASSNLFSLDFKNIPRPMHPFDEIKEFTISTCSVGHKRPE